jgi:YidC/Oxa1 family membrane protein insertase
VITGIIVLQQLEDIMRHILVWLGPHGTIGLPWPWAIVALTILVRIAIVPLAVKQIHSMQNLQRFAPQMKEIQQKYKHDKQKQNEELMRFYKEHKINPAASCLPLVAQLPVFFSLYFVLRNASDFIHYTCTQHVPLDKCAAAAKVPVDNVDWLGLVRITEHATAGWGPLLIVIYVCSQLASSYFMSTTADKTQRILLMVLPVVFVPFIIRFPAGLVLYWVTTNLWTVGQGLVTRRLIPKPTAPPKRSSRTPRKETEAEAAPAAATDGDKSDGDKPVADKGAAAPAQPKAQPGGPPRRVRRKKKRSRR